ncbi:MAG: DUF5615 family PIN-like protein [Anaerolineales bacterium]|nr:DUF5615 family PIN-like protein [Anaerolineales bacterium]
MKLLLDQDVYLVTQHFLIGLGHDVVNAAQLGLSQAEDEILILIAQDQGRIFITCDKDFGNLVFVKAIGKGVLFLRMVSSTQDFVHKELAKVLNQYPEQELSNSFVVIDKNGHRIRKIFKR